MIKNNLEEINRKALDKLCLAQPVLDKLIINPKLEYFHDPVLSMVGESRWSGHFVSDTLREIVNMYSTQPPYNIPEQVQKFVDEAKRFIYGRRN